LTEKEQKWIEESYKKYNNIAQAIRDAARPKGDGGGCANVNRVKILKSEAFLLENPPTQLHDDPNWIAWNEEQLLGTAISCSKIDSCDTSQVNCTCKEFLAGRKGFIVLGVEILRVGEYLTKAGKTPGKKMAFLTVADSSCSLSDVCVFPETYEKFSSLLIEGNTVLMQGERDYKKGSFIAKQIWQI